MSSELPEPLAHPGLLTEPPSLETVRSRVGATRLNLGLFIVGLAWLFANTMAVGTLFQAKVALVAPESKVLTLGLLSALGGLVGSLALFGWGAASDLTRSRFGRRSPWIAFGAISGAVGLLLLGVAQTVPTLLAAYLLYTVTFNALPAALLAVFPDRVPREKRGTASAVYGGAQVLGGSIASITAAQFLTDPGPLFAISAALLLVGALGFLVLAPDYSSKDEPRAALDMGGLRDAFRFPAGAPDFYWAYAGRFLLLLGLYMVQNFQLFILTDHIGLSNEEAAPVLTVAGLASLVTIVVGTGTAGPLSDKIGRRKMPIFGAAMLFAVAVALPLFWPTATSMIIFAAVSGLGLGAFLSVDSALMTEVLPSEASRGKDMGILNTANTVPGIIAPLVTSGIVSIGLGYQPVFVISLVVMLVGAVSIFKIKSVR